MPKAKPKAKAASVSSKVKEELPHFSLTKVTLLIQLMRRPEGASLAWMQEATGWQAHSVRGAMSGSIKKKHGLQIVSEKTDAGRVYRIDEASADDGV